ncbi:Sensor histidine kinase VncS [Streptococcus sp. DD10]|uniref:sensor histidine kinase n=1 Tax=Streptococcus sp. DD10 TaxID=1777878 RepID=UPI000792B801|nr:HAMP domain-containing sensor histidine kinase [Streptococcus sp. DD10]KXT74436.1 Sensor histidine kinase VncS [Streptococcus sp. DD10]
MKPLGLFTKIFISTFSIFSILVISLHLAIYLLFPTTYLNKEQENLVDQATAIAQSLEGKQPETIAQVLALYSETSEIKGNIKERATKNNIEILSKLPINKKRQTTSLVIEERTIHDQDGQTLTLQFIISMDLQKSAQDLSLRYLPYTLVTSFLISLLIAYLYARMIVAPILEIKQMTNHMMKLDPTAQLTVDSQDEIGQLKEQINRLYHHLLTAISDISQKNTAILKLERMKIEFLRGASHELKTPLASLHILLENMLYKVGRYKDRDRYLAQANQIVEQLSGHVGQILTLSSVQDLQEKKERISLAESIENLILEYHLLIKDKKIKIHNQVHQLEAMLNPSILNLILSNLISNAIKHSKNGSSIYICQQGSWLTIENTADNHELERLINVFSTDTTIPNKGSGLGLFIIKSLLEHEKLPYHLKTTEDKIVFWINFDNSKNK